MGGVCVRLDHVFPLTLRRALAVIFAVTEMLFFGGIFYGMNALYPVLHKEMIFSDLCPNPSDVNGCEPQDAMYANAFTTYSVVMMVMLVAVGLLIDYIGLRLMKLISTLVYFVGMLMFAFASSSISPIIFVGGTLAAVGGMGMMVCMLSVSQLFTTTAVVVLAFVTGSYDASSALFAVVKLTYNAGLSIRSSFLILAFCGLGMGLFSACFILSYWISDMAKYKNEGNNALEIELEEEIPDGKLTENKTDLGNAEKGNEISADTAADAILSELFPTRGKSLASFPFIVITGYFCLALLRFTFFLAELTPTANSHFNDSSTTERIGSTLSYALAGGIFAGLACGAVIDSLRAAFRPKIEYILSLEASDNRNRALLWLKLRPMAFSMYIMTFFSLIVSILIFFGLEYIYYINFFFLVIMRGFLFSTFSSSVLSAFPLAQFGTLYGIGGSIAGLFSCLQYALLLPSPYVGNGIALGLTVLLFIPPTIIISMSLISMRRVQ